MCLHTKFHANRTIFGEVITFHKFSRCRPARSRDITICNSGPHTKSPRCSELAVQIWFRKLDNFWIYRNFSRLFCHFACKMANHAHFLVNFGGRSYPQNLILIILTPKMHILGWNCVVCAINRENPSRGSTWARAREKKSNRTGQQKRHNSVIFHICGEKPPLMIMQPNLEHW